MPLGIDALLAMARHLVGDEDNAPDVSVGPEGLRVALTGPTIVGGPEPPQLSLAQMQAQLPLRGAAPGLQADENASSYRPPVIPSLRSVTGAVGGATMAPFAAALGALADQPGQLGHAGLAAWEALKKVPASVFQAPEAQRFSSPTQELQKRGVAVGPATGLFADLALDPGNYLGGEGAINDLGKLGLMGAMALPLGVKKLRSAVEAARAAAATEALASKAFGTLSDRYPQLAKALAKYQTPLELAGANRSAASALDRMATDVHAATIANEGATTYPLTGQTEEIGAPGFMVGRYSNQSGKTKAIPYADFTPEDVKRYVEQHADVFAKNPQQTLGTWVSKDEQTGAKTVYLDVSQKFPTARKASMVGAVQAQPHIDPTTGEAVVRDPVTGAWPQAQKSIFGLKKAEETNIGNLAEFLNSPEFQQRLDTMYHAGVPVMNGKEWWNLYGTSLERVYGKERVAPLAAMLASTSPASAPVHNLRTASEYLRRLIKNEPIIQKDFRIPATAVGSLEGHMGAMTLGDFNAPGTKMPMERTRAPNLRRAAAFDYATATPGEGPRLLKDKVNDMFHALTGEDVGVYDRRYAKLAEDWKRGIYVDATKDKVPGSMGKKTISPYAMIENAVRTGAKRADLPLGKYSAYVWEGIGETIKKTGELYGMKHPAHTIPEASQGFPGIFDAMVAEKAKAWGITVAELEKRLRNGDAELLTALLGTPVGMLAYRQWQQVVHQPAGAAGPPAS